MSSFLPLTYGCQNYDWGKIGKESLVYDLAHKAGVEKEENPTKPYAELWMGDHVALPSSIKQADGKNVSLRDLIKENPQKYLGKAAEQFGTQGLPFLFKVLSVNKALSLQVHPSKELAVQLHKERPDTYKDPNHKPEIAIAITELDALSNFRPFEELVKAFDEVDVLREFIGEQVVQEFKTCPEGERADKLRNIMKQFFAKDEKEKNEAIDKLLAQVNAKTEKTRRDDLVLKIHKQFPYDIGVLMNYLLNYVNLQPGEAFVMDACEPHAYVSGNILEVMACSDNVIRGCMTPKYIDKELLCQILTYNMKTTDIFKGETLHNHNADGYEVVKYPTRYEEFWCQRIEINKKDQETCSFKYEYPSIALVLKGTGKVHIKAKDQAEFEQHTVKEGECVFVLPESEVKFSNVEGEFTAYFSTSQALNK